MNDDMQVTAPADERTDTTEPETLAPEAASPRRRTRTTKTSKESATTATAVAETADAPDAPVARRRGRPPGSKNRSRAEETAEMSAVSIDDAPVPAAPLQTELLPPAPAVAAAPVDGAAPSAHVVSDREMFGETGLMTTTEPPDMPEPPAALAPAREIPARPQQYRPPREERPRQDRPGFQRPPRDDRPPG